MTKKHLIIYKADASSIMPLPYADGDIKAGFSSPAEDYIDLTIDLNKEIIKHPFSIFLSRVAGDRMQDTDLDIGDIVVIDKSVKTTKW